MMRSWTLAVAGAALALPLAMAVAQPAAIPSSDPADRLAANLLVLSQNPRDVAALTEAGLSAIAVGDGNAALGFLARAEQIAPRDGRIKAALGSALLLLEKPADALKLFADATSVGFPEHQLAADRGLAHDLRGESRAAQRDYALALRHRDDDETVRRYALSLGISGDRDKALALLDPLLRRQDRAAWRARAFVLAMSGDVAGAQDVAGQIMPGNAAASMAPFLRRLASMNAAERALAVNLGIMPAEGQRLASASTADFYRGPAALTGGALIPAGEPLAPRAVDTEPASTVAPVSREPRRRPGREAVAMAQASPARPQPESPAGDVESPPARPEQAAGRTGTALASTGRINNRIGPVDPARFPEGLRGLTGSSPAPGTGPAANAPPPPRVVALAGVTALPPPDAARPAMAEPATPPAPAPVVEESAPQPVFEVPSTLVAAASAPPQPAAAAPSVPPAAAAGGPAADPVPVNLAAVIATLQPEAESAAGPLPDEAALRAARIAAQRKAAAEAKAAEAARLEKEKRDAERLNAQRNPARIWVQVATGANEAGLPLTWKRLREKAPDALKGLAPSTAPFKATNRLLVGPFKSAAEARKTVNALASAGISVFTFTSEAGQEIAKLAVR